MIKDLYKKPYCVCDVNVLENYHRVYKNLYDFMQRGKMNADVKLLETKTTSALHCEKALNELEHHALDHMLEKLDEYFLEQMIVKANGWKQDLNYDE